MEGAVTPRSPRGRTHGYRAGLAVAAAVLLAIVAPHLADPALHDLVTVITGAIAVLVAGPVVARDAAARSAAESERDLLHEAIATLPCHFAVFDRKNVLIACNDAYRALHAHGFATARGRVTYEHLMREVARRTVPPDQVEAEVQRRVTAHAVDSHQSFERVYPGDIWVRVEKHRLSGGEMAGMAIDITALKRAEEKVVHLATHDALTGLGNRGAFQETLAARLRSGEPAALLLVDLDGFKQVNDAHGHAVGDALLLEVGRRIGRTLRARDRAFRLGGDEFAVVLAGLGAEEVATLAGGLVVALSRPAVIEGLTVGVSASIGSAIAPTDGAEPDALMIAADLALYEAKRGGRQRVVAFRPELRRANEREAWLRDELARALVGEGLELHWQPQVSLPSRTLVGAEALLRWRHPHDGSLLLPGDFLDVAASAGLMPAIDAWVLRTALAQARCWQGVAGAPQRVAINASPRSLADPGFPALVTAELRVACLPAAALEIEVPESIATRDLDRISDGLARLRDAGVKVALDDFGGGLSAVQHRPCRAVARGHVEARSVDRLGPARQSALAGSAARNDGDRAEPRLEVVAEGVETEGQAFALRREGCTVVQGRLAGEPVEAGVLVAPHAAPELRAIA